MLVSYSLLQSPQQIFSERLESAFGQRKVATGGIHSIHISNFFIFLSLQKG